MFSLVAFGLFAVLVPAQASATASSDALVCRAKSASDGTYELVLSWEGNSAKGSLRQIAPSGNVTTQRIRAERQGSLIVADDIWEKDLVAHAAVVQEQGGKRYMRAGNERTWLACE
jgi:hypothetical protein